MLPAGAPTEDTLHALIPLLGRGDVVVDGANAMYRDSQRHALELARHEIGFVDAGVSRAACGASRTVTGSWSAANRAAVHAVEPVLRALAPAPERGWVHCGPAGADISPRWSTTAIEYGMMQAYAEGFALMRAKTELALDVPEIAEAWRHGTVIRSWLLDLTAEFLARMRNSPPSRRSSPTRAKAAGPRTNRSSSACRRR